MAEHKKLRRSEAGITLIETMMAGAILVIGSLSMMGLIIDSIATNNRNKIDSTQTMLAESILEQINSTFMNGTSKEAPSALVDCSGTHWVIDTTPSSTSTGARLTGTTIDDTHTIDFTEVMVANPTASTDPLWGFHMNYVLSTPCDPSTGIVQATYDVRWHIDQIGTTSTYLITVAARLMNHGEGNKFFSLPVTLHFMTGS